MQPFIMGILVSVIVGMVLTLPISSAALCAMIGISGLAGGAATASAVVLPLATLVPLLVVRRRREQGEAERAGDE